MDALLNLKFSVEKGVFFVQNPWKELYSNVDTSMDVRFGLEWGWDGTSLMGSDLQVMTWATYTFKALI